MGGGGSIIIVMYLSKYVVVCDSWSGWFDGGLELLYFVWFEKKIFVIVGSLCVGICFVFFVDLVDLVR